MSIFTEMVRGASTAGRLFALLETGQMANTIGDIELSAAKDAFARIATAKDKRGQVQICVGHLNSAYSAYVHIIDDAGFLDRTLVSRVETLEAARIKGCFVLCLRSICFAYLGEISHCEQDLRSASRLKNKEVDSGTAASIWFISGISINPIAAYDLLYCAVRSHLRPDNNDDFKIEDDLIDELECKLLPHRQLDQT
jgi:hypothetical protein